MNSDVIGTRYWIPPQSSGSEPYELKYDIECSFNEADVVGRCENIVHVT